MRLVCLCNLISERCSTLIANGSMKRNEINIISWISFEYSECCLYLSRGGRFHLWLISAIPEAMKQSRGCPVVRMVGFICGPSPRSPTQ